MSDFDGKLTVSSALNHRNLCCVPRRYAPFCALYSSFIYSSLYIAPRAVYGNRGTVGVTSDMRDGRDGEADGRADDRR